MQLIGRREELDRIAQVVSGIHESALLIVGETGSGKSHLLDAAGGQTSIRSTLVQTMPAEASWPFSGFARVFAFSEEVSAIDVASKVSAFSGQRGELFDVARDILATLRAVPVDPILLLVDDVDRMDVESQALLSLIADGLANTGIRLVASATEIPPSNPLAGFRRITLGVLTPIDARELADSTAGPSGDAGTAQIIADNSGGSPATIVENAHTLNELQLQGKEPLVLPFRPSPSQLSFARHALGRVGEDEKKFLELVALAPMANTSGLLSLDGTDIDALEEVLYSELVTVHGNYIQIRDPRLRSALYWGLDSRTRRELHGRLAEVYRAADPRLAGWHSSFLHHNEETTEELLGAAAQFAEEGCSPAAIEFTERALRLASSKERHLSRVVDLAATLLNQAELDLARRYALQARPDCASADMSVRVAAVLASIDYARTHIVPTNDIDATLSIYATNAPAGALRLLSIAASFHAERWEVAEARRYLARAESLSPSVPDLGRGELEAVRLLVNAIDPAHAKLTHSMEEAAGALADGFPTDSDTPDAALVGVATWSPQALILCGKTLMYVEQYARARHVLTIALTRPQPTSALWAESARFFLAVNEIRAGNYHRARAACEEWLTNTVPPRQSKASRQLLHGWYLQSTGQLVAAKTLFEQCMEQTLVEHNSGVAAQALALQGEFALSEGKFEEAARLLEFADVIGQSFANPALTRASIDLVEAYVATKRLREARSVLDALDAHRDRFPSRWLTLAVARGRALVAPDDECIVAFRAALDLFEADDSPYALGRTLTNFASAQSRLGLVRESEKTAAAARNAFANAGVQSWVDRADHVHLAPETTPLSALGVLTEEEQLIVEKVREGYRNKEIAAAMYISLRTVELRLTHIYRKVGARSRSHLAALLG
ncbi:MAG TPA: AAA family ATPase [Glaciihabitans sp.]|jgi:DNA-binding CsgD family transcriptional regulator|nr:AAA family ATPase [Glaciihabitans sp.]